MGRAPRSALLELLAAITFGPVPEGISVPIKPENKPKVPA
jgi:hypothetical protein